MSLWAHYYYAWRGCTDDNARCFNGFISCIPSSVESVLAPASSSESYRDKLLAVVLSRQGLKRVYSPLDHQCAIVEEACRWANGGKILLDFAESYSRRTLDLQGERLHAFGYWTHLSKTDMKDHRGCQVTRYAFSSRSNSHTFN